MIKVFNTLSEYNTYVEGGLVSGDLYYVKEDDSVHFQTNNIDGELAVYDFAPDSGESEFVPVLVDATFTANGTYDPADYEATGFDTVTVNVAAPELTWEQATPNASYYNAKMVDGLEIGKTYRIHITYTWQEDMYSGKPYFYFVYSNNNSWNNYSNVINPNDGKYYQIQIEADSEDFYFDITFPKFSYNDGGDDYGIAIEQGSGLYPAASMEIALLD